MANGYLLSQLSDVNHMLKLSTYWEGVVPSFVLSVRFDNKPYCFESLLHEQPFLVKLEASQNAETIWKKQHFFIISYNRQTSFTYALHM